MPLHIETPLIESRALSANGRSVWLKCEALQPVGSFKIRGIGLACETYAARGARQFISSSGGNAGIAVAYAGRKLGIPVTVVVPNTTTERAKAMIREQAATVVVHGASWQEANAHAQLMLGERNERNECSAFLHPFDDPLLWQGHASMIDEVGETAVQPDVVVLSVGGGGLLAGVVEGLQRNGLAHVPIIAVETHGAASLASAMAAKLRVEIPAITSIATSLGAKQIAARAFELTQTYAIDSALVSDLGAVIACERFLDDHRMLVEPACGAALSIVYDDLPALRQYRNILVIVCGGATATLANLQQWRKQLEVIT
jgi:L-serine/L-threonine ammonia-lyase